MDTNNLLRHLEIETECRGGVWFVNKDELFSHLFQSGYAFNDWVELRRMKKIRFTINDHGANLHLRTMSE